MPLNSENNVDSAGNPLLTRDMMQILGDLQDAVLFFDREWKLIYANSNARRISRLEQEHVNQRSHWDLFPDALGVVLERKYRSAMEGRIEERHDFFYEAFSLWIESRIVPIHSGVALIYRDVTSEKHEEEGRLLITRQLNQVLEVTTDAIFYLDHNYTFTFLNRRAKELLAPEDDLLGSNVWQRFPSAFYAGSPFVESYRESMEKRVPCDFESYYPAPLNKWFCVQSRPAGSGIIVFFRDITQARHDVEVLRQQHEDAERERMETESLYCNAPVGLALFDPVDFCYLRANNHYAQFFAMTPSQLIGKKAGSITRFDGLLEGLAQAAGGQAIHGHAIHGELATTPGELRHWQVDLDPVYASDGKVQAITAASVEITAQKRAEAALIQNEKLAAVGQITMSISHEINNPLESVTNLLYLLATDEALPASLKTYVKTAEGELARVSQIVTQTLSFHRETVSAVLIESEVLLGAVLDLYRSRLTNGGVVVETQYRSKTPFLCFENDTRQVLNNLIANAIDAMPTGGRLLVRSHDATWAGQRGIRLTVADIGTGMSSTTRTRACEPFYTTKKSNGTGLGLWISSDIMRRHGGKLRFRSSQDPAHHGTVFSLFQPLVAVTAVEGRVLSSRVADEPFGGRGHLAS